MEAMEYGRGEDHGITGGRKPPASRSKRFGNANIIIRYMIGCSEAGWSSEENPHTHSY